MELTTIEKIKQIAEDEKLTRYRIAQKSGVNPRLLQHYWNGTTAPSITNVEKIVKAMGYEIKIEKREEKQVFLINETHEVEKIKESN